MSLGPFEILIILIVAVLVFGRRLPDVGRTVGRGVAEFKRGLHDLRRNVGFDDEIRDIRDLGRDAARDHRVEDSVQAEPDDSSRSNGERRQNESGEPGASARGEPSLEERDVRPTSETEPREG